jgi:hypothetical protein
MKRLVLNMVCRENHNSPDSDGVLVRMETDSGGTLVYPLFLREVGKYYWNKKQFILQYKIILKTCIENGYTKMFRFFHIQKLFSLASENGHLGVASSMRTISELPSLL